MDFGKIHNQSTESWDHEYSKRAKMNGKPNKPCQQAHPNRKIAEL